MHNTDAHTGRFPSFSAANRSSNSAVLNEPKARAPADPKLRRRSAQLTGAPAPAGRRPAYCTSAERDSCRRRPALLTRVSGLPNGMQLGAYDKDASDQKVKEQPEGGGALQR